jgi:hypothetical protein
MIDPNLYRKSAYMKASDLTTPRTKVRIAEVAEEEVGTPAETKVVLQFTTTTLKPKVCNYSNLVTLVEGFGPDETQWRGKVIVLVKTKVLFQGRLVDTVSIEIPPQPASPPPAPPSPASSPPDIPEEILAADEEELI